MPLKVKPLVVVVVQALAALGSLAALGCGGGRGPIEAGGDSSKSVVVYSALDEEFARPVLKGLADRLSLDVRPKFDVESTKTIGLTYQIISEAVQPRCDLFWNNEILNTIRLKQRGQLTPFEPSRAADLPEAFRDRDQTWYGFAARARILLVNTDLVPAADRPRGIADLVDPKWKGKIGIAKPLFGTTATHATCLFSVWGDPKAEKYFRDLRTNEVQVLSGNKQVATAVGAGRIAFGLTDTDDAMGEIAAGSPVAIVYPDREPDQLGTLFIPNTIAIIKNGPHPEAARRLADQILSAEVENELAAGPSAQIPLLKGSAPSRIETPATVHPMAVDFEAAAGIWNRVARFLAAEFAG